MLTIQALVGSKYERSEIATMLGYKGYQALTAGVICPVKVRDIFLFVNRGSRPDFTAYSNDFNGEMLSMDGRTDHLYDDRLVGSRTSHEAVHLFFREGRRGKFTYFGQMELVDSELFVEKPSRFSFRRLQALADEGSSGGPGHDESDDAFMGPEGKPKLALHVRYERNKGNRDAAIARHGRRCSVCSMSFDATYGPELARMYIEVHHTISISLLRDTAPNVDDLIPLCANCHRMAHRSSGELVPVSELREAYLSRQK